MLVTLRGEITEKIGDQLVLEANGVGYGVYVTTEDQASLTVGREAKLYLYEQLREDVQDLYGFTTLAAKEFFEQLVGVNGVGPRMALNMLSIGSADTIRQAIAAGDTKYLQTAQGVGRRVAERVVVELKDKVGLASSVSDDIFVGSTHAAQDEAVQGLLALGFDTQDALKALQGVDEKLPAEERIKLALKKK